MQHNLATDKETTIMKECKKCLKSKMQRQGKACTLKFLRHYDVIFMASYHSIIIKCTNSQTTSLGHQLKKETRKCYDPSSKSLIQSTATTHTKRPSNQQSANAQLPPGRFKKHIKRIPFPFQTVNKSATTALKPTRPGFSTTDRYHPLSQQANIQSSIN